MGGVCVCSSSTPHTQTHIAGRRCVCAFRAVQSWMVWLVGWLSSADIGVCVASRHVLPLANQGQETSLAGHRQLWGGPPCTGCSAHLSWPPFNLLPSHFLACPECFSSYTHDLFQIAENTNCLHCWSTTCFLSKAVVAHAATISVWISTADAVCVQSHRIGHTTTGVCMILGAIKKSWKRIKSIFKVLKWLLS